MNEPALDRATHFSIVWAVVLAVLTLVEWSSLEREPMSEQIFLPFIEREIRLSTTEASTITQLDTAAEESAGSNPGRTLQTHVTIDFNGPLFLALFFGPILVFHAIGMLVRQLRRDS